LCQSGFSPKTAAATAAKTASAPTADNHIKQNANEKLMNRLLTDR
jgi:hypothetical protein